MKFLKLCIIVFTGLAFCSSCNEDNPLPEPEPTEFTSGVFIMNAGKKDQNNASISYYNTETGNLTADIYMEQNNRGLGDKAESMIMYGSKLYVTVYASNRLDIIDARSGVSLKQLEMESPRCLAAAGGKVFVTLYGGHVCQVDTVSMELEKTADVGLNPQGICVKGNELFVAITKGIGGERGETLDVVDITSFTKTREIPVVLNPQYVYADSEGDLYVFSYGDYKNIKYVMTRIDGETGEQTEIEGLKAGKMAVKGDVAYIMCNDYYAEGDKNSIVVYDLKNEVILSANFVTDGTELGTLNGIGVDPVSGDVYVSQSDSNNNGDVSIFSSDGKLKSKLEVEVYPADIAFATGYKLPEE